MEQKNEGTMLTKKLFTKQYKIYLKIIPITMWWAAVSKCMRHSMSEPPQLTHRQHSQPRAQGKATESIQHMSRGWATQGNPIEACTHTRTHETHETHKNTQKHTQTHTNTHKPTQTHTHKHTYICVCVCVCHSVYVCVWLKSSPYWADIICFFCF